jgi:hypothetical protein
MKKVLYLLPLLVAFGCGKSDTPGPNNTYNGPLGTFAGAFTYLHKHSNTGVVDTLRANITLSLQLTTGFKVTGDTLTVHAGSYGTAVVDWVDNVIDFADQTYPVSGAPAKSHLNGSYAYAYDGTILQMVAGRITSDTVVYQYNLKRTGN